MRTPRSIARSRPLSRTSREDRLKQIGRVGLVAYGVVYLIIGWLAVQLAVGDRQGNPSSTGALRELAQQPLGEVLVWVVSIGMLLLALWQAVEAVLGDDGAGQRLACAGKALVYAVIGFSGIRVAVGAGSSSKGSDTWTAKVLDLPAGQVLVGLVALAIIGFGLYEIYRGWSDKFAKELTQEGRRGAAGTAYLWFGRAGCVARGVAFVVVGGLFGYAAITHDAKKSGGLDQALLEVLDQPYGPLLLVLIGLGLACFGLFTLARARHLRR